MKRFLPRILVVIGICYSHFVIAQWVTIPTGFATYISTYVTAAAIRNGNQLDTTNSTITTLQNMTISTQVTDITGIQYFKSLQNLVTNGSNVPRLPAQLLTCEVYYVQGSIYSPLPSSLIALKLHDGSFNSLPTLPMGLQKLIINDNQGITTLPAIPASVTYIDLSSSNFTSLPTLPANLDTLVLYDCISLVSGTFPSNLPLGLQYLDVSYTAYGYTIDQLSDLSSLTDFIAPDCINITSLPPMPPNLTDIQVSGCAIQYMDTFPHMMYTLDISNNPISFIYNLPDTIWGLDIADLYSLQNGLYLNNYITIISSLIADNSDIGPDFLSGTTFMPESYVSARNAGINGFPDFYYPESFNSLDLSDNPIGSIPGLPNIGSFTCSYCQLDSSSLNNIMYYIQPYYSPYTLILDHNNFNNNIHSMSPDMYWLDLSCNKITGFDVPVSSFVAILDSNNIYCLPWIQNVNNGGYYPGCQCQQPEISLIGDPINCLPNMPSPYLLTNLPVCQAGNSNGCGVFSEVNGVTFNDISNNGVKDSGEAAIGNIYVQMQPGNYLSLSNAGGNYSFNCQVDTNYTIGGVQNLPYRTISSAPFQVEFSGLGFIDSFKNIGVHTIPNVNDLEMFLTSVTQPRPGFYQSYNLTATNIGTTIENGSVVMYFSPSLVYKSSNPAGVVNGNTVTWQLSSLVPLSSFNANVDFLIPVPVPLGTLINAGAYALGNLPDSTISNNHDTISQIAIGSYDPNNKSVSPADGLSQQDIQNGAYLDYTVRFQNTGTASAINITVTDTLSPYLNISTFQFVTASNVNVWSIQNRVLSVTFKGIDLQDSLSNEPASHGFFRYRIEPFTTVLAGTNISNTAQIYFDFNPAIVTNTAVTNVTTYILQQPVAQILCSGEPLNLSIVTNTGVTGVSWYKDGIALGITTDTLHIDSSTVADNGDYACYVTTGAGVFASNTVLVQVFDHTQNSAVVFTPSSPSALCQYSGYLTVGLANTTISEKMNLYVNGILLDTYTGSVDYLDPWTFKNGDTLTAIATDSSYCTKTETSTAQYIFDFLPLDTARVIISPTNPNVCPGSSFTFTAQTPNFPNSTVQWSHNGVVAGTGLTMNIANLQNNDVILAQVTNSDGYSGCLPVFLYSTYDTLHLNGKATPAITVTPNTQGICTGQTVIYSANVTNQGNNNTYQWKKDNAVVGSNQNTFTDNAPANNDLISCTVITNECSGVGYDTASGNYLATVTGAGASSVNIQLVSYTNSCVSAAFTATPVLAGPAPTYQWYKNGALLTGQTRQTDTITGLTGGDTITCSMNSGLSCETQPVFSAPLRYMGATSVVATIYTSANVYGLANGYKYCPGTATTFTSSTGAFYLSSHILWYKNGVMVGTGSTYTTGTTDTGAYDIYAAFKAYSCNRDTISNTLHMTPVPPTTVTGNLSVSAYSGCGRSITIKLNELPSDVPGLYYSWSRVDSVIVSSGIIIADSIAFANIVNGEVIGLSFTPLSSLSSCVTGSLADSVQVQIIGNKPSVSISTPTTTLCGGSQGKTFTAQNVYGGYYPVYQWMKNTTKVGTNLPTYTASSLNIGDSIKCIMTSDNPCALPQTATSNTIIITTGSGTTYTPTISISPATVNICKGTAITFNSSITFGGSNPIYVWQVNGTAHAGINSASFVTSSLNNNDVVKCTLYSNIGCLTADSVVSNSATATVTDTSSASISITGPASTCSGTPVSYTSSINNGGGNPVYQWMRNGIAAGSSAGYTDNTPVDGERVMCVLVSDKQCVLNPSDTSNVISLTVTETASPQVSVNPELPGGSCAGTIQAYTAVPVNGGTNPAYQWLLNGQPLANDTNATLLSSFYNGDQLTVQMTSSLNCTTTATVTSPPDTVIARSLPPIPVVTPTGDVLSSSAVSGNQWYLDDIALPGATSQTYRALETGWYLVKVTNNFECTSSSDSLYLLATGITETGNEISVSVYPNPVNELLTIESASFLTSKAVLLVKDISGQIVTPEMTSAGDKIILHTGNLATGVYFVTIQINNSQLVRRFTKVDQ